MRHWFSAFLALLLGLGLSGCDSGANDNVTRVGFIGSESDLKADGLRLSVAGQHVRAATAQGLVGRNERGEIVPALAERWIITDDGLSFIFRLSNDVWPDGTRLTGENVRSALLRNISGLRGTSLGIDLEIISDIKAMTGRVVEIRLKSPMPQFLELLAQPELGLRQGGTGTGPMNAISTEKAVILDVRPETGSQLEGTRAGAGRSRRLIITSTSAADATEAFDNDKVDLVINGQLLSLPLANTGPLARGTVRLDVVFGLFGLKVRNTQGLLSDASRREALAMAIDRDTLLESFAVGGWAQSTRIVPAGLPGNPIEGEERWAGQPVEVRQTEARRRIAGWKNGPGNGEAKLTIELPDRAGTDRLFSILRRDLGQAGVTLERVKKGKAADLVLVDSVARYGDARWFLNQFNCRLKNGPCAADADAMVAEAVGENDPARRAQLLADAESTLLQSNIYIPFGAPVRWSLISGGVNGFIENGSGVHPLFPMALRPM